MSQNSNLNRTFDNAIRKFQHYIRKLLKNFVLKIPILVELYCTHVWDSQKINKNSLHIYNINKILKNMSVAL